MESSSKTVKHVYVPPGTLAKGVRTELQSIGFSSDMNNLTHNDSLAPFGFDQILEGDTLFPHDEEEMQDTRRSKKTERNEWYKNVAGLKVGENVAPRSFDQTFEGDTLFPHEEEEMLGTQRSEIRLKVGENVAPPSFDQTFEGDTVLFPHEEEEMQGTHRSEIRFCESEKVKKLRGRNWCKNVAGLKVGENVAPPSFGQIFESNTDLFPHEEEEMQGT
ncbi:uncharacterized protein [Nicotiana sylvestris]|uniref:uncharacterized protein n=1 Tax=Nicotiana sylvestris TaxID=4096 RepID=UPI00388CD146